MRFAHPEILWFLFAVAVPPIIHLLRLRRYKRIYFSNVRLLEQIEQEKKRSSRLREIAVMLARMAAIACVVLAFARPFLPENAGTAPVSQSLVSVYVDNSFSMQAPSRGAVLLEEAKTQAERILRDLPPDRPVHLFTNDFSGFETGFISQDEALRRLRDIDYSPLSRSFDQIRAFQKRVCEEASVAQTARLCYCISDFQKSTLALRAEALREDSSGRFVFVPVQGVDYANLSMDSLSLDMPVLQAGRDMGLRIRLTNRSDREQLQVPLRVYVQGRQAGVYPVDFKAGEEVEMRIPFRLEEKGLYGCYVEIADYPVEFDNRLYFSINIKDAPRILHIYEGEAETSLRKLFAGDSLFVYTAQEVHRLSFDALASSGLVILDKVREPSSALVAALVRHVRGGGRLAVLPPAPSENSQAPLQELLTTLIGSGYGAFHTDEIRLRSLNHTHPIFALALAQVPETRLLPQVKGRYDLPETPHTPYTALMSFSAASVRPAQDFLRVYTPDKGMVYLFSSPLSESTTDFGSHYSFVLAFLNMALWEGSGPRLYETTGTEEALFYPAALWGDFSPQTRYYVQADGGRERMIPLVRRMGAEVAVYTYGQILEAGNYTLG
ncbi:MAG: BatA domain-containing protein, partial [Bacteroidales bacterium]|nr:BatA domain-containing protein [Bacteroidales bacterium]